MGSLNPALQCQQTAATQFGVFLQPSTSGEHGATVLTNAVVEQYDLLKHYSDGRIAREVLHQLSVFCPEAGFTLQAVQSIVRLGDNHAGAVVRALQELVNRDLLNQDNHANCRYSLSKPIAVFANAHLDDKEAVASRFVDYYLQLIQRAHETYLLGGARNIKEALEIFDTERGQLDYAWGWMMNRSNLPLDERFLCFTQYMTNIGHLRYHKRSERIPQLEMAAKIAETCGKTKIAADMLGYLGMAYADIGEEICAIEYYKQSIKMAQKCSARHCEGRVVGALGLAYFGAGKFTKAKRLFLEQLAITHELGDRRLEVYALGGLGLYELAIKNYDRALSYFDRNFELASHPDLMHLRSQGYALGGQALTRWHLGDTKGSIALFDKQLSIMVDIGDPRGTAHCSWNLGFLRTLEGLNDGIYQMHECLEYETVIADPQATESKNKIEQIEAGKMIDIVNTRWWKWPRRV